MTAYDPENPDNSISFEKLPALSFDKKTGQFKSSWEDSSTHIKEVTILPTYLVDCKWSAIGFLNNIRDKDIAINNTIYFNKITQQFTCYHDGRWYVAITPSIELKSPIERLITNSVNIHQLPDEYNNLSSPINTNMI